MFFSLTHKSYDLLEYVKQVCGEQCHPVEANEKSKQCPLPLGLNIFVGWCQINSKYINKIWIDMHIHVYTHISSLCPISTQQDDFVCVWQRICCDTLISLSNSTAASSVSSIIYQQTDLWRSFQCLLHSAPPFQWLFRRTGLWVVYGGQRREDSPRQAVLCPAEGVFRRHRRRKEPLCGWPGTHGWVKYEYKSNSVEVLNLFIHTFSCRVLQSFLFVSFCFFC